MKSTGVIRRIDDLGRIVIPKEIRKNLRINEGDPTEIYVEKDSIILKKVDTLESLRKELEAFIEVLSKYISVSILVTDLRNVVYVKNTSKEKYLNKKISFEIQDIIKDREKYTTKNSRVVEILEEDTTNYISQYIIPLIENSYVAGSIIVFSNEVGKKITDEDIKIIEICSKLVLKILE